MIMGFAESGQGKEVLGVVACVKDDGIISDGLLELRCCGEKGEEGFFFFFQPSHLNKPQIATI